MSDKDSREELKDVAITSLGKAEIRSPLKEEKDLYVTDSDRVIVHTVSKDLAYYLDKGIRPPMFEMAGPREYLYHNPDNTVVGIVTCGGLSPGLNDVVRSIVLSSLWQYGVKKVLGFRYGFAGMTSKPFKPPVELTPEYVDEIQQQGGTVLGSSRGSHDVGEMVDILKKHGVGVLYAIGGDGTFAGAHALAGEVERRGEKISIIGIPKTIDNDILYCDRTFGFSTAVEEARKALYSAHEEAKSAWNGIGLVKLMGRDSGFISVAASLGNSDVNYCFIPEVQVRIRGEDGFLSILKKRLNRKHHAVIAVSEGFGQNLMNEGVNVQHDASGNVRYKDVGRFLKEEIESYFHEANMPVTVKYIEPSYMIRSCPANADDSAFCIMLGQSAVHAGMAGKTDMFVSLWNGEFVNIPLVLAMDGRKKVDTKGILWQTFVETTKRVSKESFKGSRSGNLNY